MRTFDELKAMIVQANSHGVISGSIGRHSEYDAPVIQVRGTFVAVTKTRLSSAIPAECPVICRWTDSFAGPSADKVSVTFYPDETDTCRIVTECEVKHLDISIEYASARKSVLSGISTEDLAAELDSRRGHGEFIVFQLSKDMETGGEYSRLLNRGWVHYHSEAAGDVTFVTLRRRLKASAVLEGIRKDNESAAESAREIKAFSNAVANADAAVKEVTE